MIVVKELEPDLSDGTVIWNNDIISFPCFRPAAHEDSVVVKSQEGSIKQSSRRKFHKKVKTSSTQTEPQLQAVSRPGMHYMETSPGKEELFDSFSSLSSVNCTMEQLQVMPQQHKEQAINLLTLETTKKHLTGKNAQHGKRKKQNKKEKLKVDEEHNVSLSSTTHAKLNSHETLKGNSMQSTDSPVHVPCTVKSTHTSAVTRQPQHSSYNLTSTSFSDTVTHNVPEQSHSTGDIVTHHAWEQPHSSNIVTHHTQEQPHSSDIVTHHTQVQQPHSSDIVTHHTQEQPHSSDIVTHHTQEQSRIIQQVKHWSKFEQLKAKYLPQSIHSSGVTSHNHKMLYSRFLAKQKLN